MTDRPEPLTQTPSINPPPEAGPSITQIHPRPIGDGAIDDVGAAIRQEKRLAKNGGALPWVYTNMITSLDGGTAVDATSGGLGGAGDRAVFAALRDVADVIVVGAATVRAEEYRPPRRSDAVRARRLDEGRQPDPVLAVVTRSLDLSPDLPLFSDPGNKPLVFTAASAPEAKRAALTDVAEVIDAGEDEADLVAVLFELQDRGARTVLCEGGPRINGQLAALGLVDEWNLTISPHLLAGNSHRAALGPLPEGPPPSFSLQRIWADDDYLFCRWVRKND